MLALREIFNVFSLIRCFHKILWSQKDTEWMAYMGNPFNLICIQQRFSLGKPFTLIDGLLNMQLTVAQRNLYIWCNDTEHKQQQKKNKTICCRSFVLFISRFCFSIFFTNGKNVFVGWTANWTHSCNTQLHHQRSGPSSICVCSCAS